MTQTDRRRYVRRARSIRMRFELAGEEHRCVTTTVSPGGAQVKAAYIPERGAMVVFREVYNPGAPVIYIRGQVRWRSPPASLDQPDTGFGVRFVELFTRDDPQALEDFLLYIDPDMPRPPELAFEERTDGVYVVYRFPEERAAEAAALAEPELGEEELLAVDLEGELRRLAAREERPAAAQGEGSPGGSGAPAPRGQRPRSRRRTVTGIFTALFGKKREADEFDAAATPSPEVPGPSRGALRDAHRPQVLLGWGEEVSQASVESLSRRRASLRVSGPTPSDGVEIGVTPLDMGKELAGFTMSGRVTRQVGDGGGGVLLDLDLRAPADAHAAVAFEAYLKAVNGPRFGR